MGAWGTAIFSDDFACDVRDDYIEQLVAGKTNEEATQAVIDKHYLEVKGTEDESVFWFSLALTQWKRGRLTNDVKDKAFKFIENGSDLSRWNTPGNEKNYKKRLKVIKELEDTLSSPMPKAKRIYKPSWVWRSHWREGALLCYKVIDERAISKYIGKYILVRIIEIVQSKSNGYITETIRLGLYGWIGDSVPDSSIAETLGFIELSDTTDPILGRMLIRAFCTTITKKEIKERNIVCIGYDESYRIDIPEFFKSPQVFNAFASLVGLDISFTKALDRYFGGNHLR